MSNKLMITVALALCSTWAVAQTSSSAQTSGSTDTNQSSASSSQSSGSSDAQKERSGQPATQSDPDKGPDATSRGGNDSFSGTNDPNVPDAASMDNSQPKGAEVGGTHKKNRKHKKQVNQGSQGMPKSDSQTPNSGDQTSPAAGTGSSQTPQ